VCAPLPSALLPVGRWITGVKDIRRVFVTLEAQGYSAERQEVGGLVCAHSTDEYWCQPVMLVFWVLGSLIPGFKQVGRYMRCGWVQFGTDMHAGGIYDV
jgi:hypothetical protein